MNSRLGWSVTSALVWLTMSCGGGGTNPTALGLQPSALCGNDADIGTFEDANLEAAVRSALSVGTQQDLTCGLLSTLTTLLASNAGIESLVGIQNLTSLKFLDLFGNSISDIGALSGLTSLEHLFLFGNSISDISALSGLTSLIQLNLDFNSISDISALSGLRLLKVLTLDFNSITDIGALRGLENLKFINLNDNPNLTDIEPLLNNRGLGSEDTVDLSNTNVSCAAIAALQAKGVMVISDCP